jgi:hypothetical protein
VAASSSTQAPFVKPLHADVLASPIGGPGADAGLPLGAPLGQNLGQNIASPFGGTDCTDPEGAWL